MTGDLFTYKADSIDNGQRLDRVLQRLKPELSLRGARRILERGLAQVNGRKRGALYRVTAGDALVVHSEPTRPGGVDDAGVRLLRLTEKYAFFHKPAGLHTASISGSGEASLEALLSALHPDHDLRLLTRLDRETSGIIACALFPEAEETFRTVERTGQVNKYYLAQVHGEVVAPLYLNAALDTDSRRKTRCLRGKSGDRITRAEPLVSGEKAAAALWGAPPEGPSTLMLVCIRRGARHQIRAHLAHAGFPLIGDTLYGTRREGALPLRLHHACLVFPGLCIRDLPDCPCFTEALKDRIGS